MCLIVLLKCIAHLNVHFCFLTKTVLLGGASLDRQGVTRVLLYVLVFCLAFISLLYTYQTVSGLLPGGGHLELEFVEKQVSTFCCWFVLLTCLAYLNAPFCFLTKMVLLGEALLGRQGVTHVLLYVVVFGVVFTR